MGVEPGERLGRVRRLGLQISGAGRARRRPAGPAPRSTVGCARATTLARRDVSTERDRVQRRDAAGVAHVARDTAEQPEAVAAVDDGGRRDVGPHRLLLRGLGLADLGRAPRPRRGTPPASSPAAAARSGAASGHDAAVHRAVAPPRPHLLGDEREVRREQPQQRVERERERGPRRRGAGVVGRSRRRAASPARRSRRRSPRRTARCARAPARSRTARTRRSRRRPGRRARRAARGRAERR